MTHEDPQDDGGAVHFELEDVHFATTEEKKRLWFRDAFINALFIASWCVPDP
jgi:solute carrier family 35 protein C2